jgi:hypothetical protein
MNFEHKVRIIYIILDVKWEILINFLILLFILGGLYEKFCFCDSCHCFLVFCSIAPSSSSSKGTTHNYQFDIKSNKGLSLKLKSGAFRLTRSLQNITNAPFCQFSKYQIMIYYAAVSLYNGTSGSGSSINVIINRDSTNGILLDLATQKLSDILPAVSLMISNALGTWSVSRQ